MGEVSKAKALSNTVRDNVGRIYISTICPVGSDEVGEYAYANQIAKISGGFVWGSDGGYSADGGSEDEPLVEAGYSMRFAAGRSDDVKSDEAKIVINHVKEVLPLNTASSYIPIISAIGYKEIRLPYPIGSYYTAKNATQINESYTAQVRFSDMDGDGLRDWEEIALDSPLLKHENQGTSEATVKLPTIQECFDYYANGEKQLFYVKNGLDRFDASHTYYYMTARKTTCILPINSDPDSPDSDGDKIVDSILFFNNKAYTDLSETEKKAKYFKTDFSDPTPLKFDYLWEWPVVTTSGEKVETVRSSFIETVGRNPVHKAIDIEAGRGIPVKAMYKGMVTFTSKEYRGWCDHDYACTCNGSYGNYVDIMSEIDGKFYLHRYAHLSFISVKTGIEIEAGYIIGNVGTSGYSSGYHLDFSLAEIKGYHSISDAKGVLISPTSWVDPLLFDKQINVHSRASFDTTPYKCKLLLNIPKGIKSTCTSCSATCGEYINDVKRKYGLPIAN
jgi:murein DD-endopeptidase MepM/ murein hydrolase activator NlpD